MTTNEEKQLDGLLKNMLKTHVHPEKAPAQFTDNVMGKLDSHLLAARKPSPLISPRGIVGAITLVALLAIGLSSIGPASTQSIELPYLENLARQAPKLPRGWGWPSALIAATVGIFGIMLVDRFLKKMIWK